jgi:hypothetical protein
MGTGEAGPKSNQEQVLILLWLDNNKILRNLYFKRIRYESGDQMGSLMKKTRGQNLMPVFLKRNNLTKVALYFMP